MTGLADLAPARTPAAPGPGPLPEGALRSLDLAVLRTILDSIWLSSDSDIDAVLAHLGMHAPAGALLTTGDYPHYETMAFALLTRSFPLYRVIWVLAPVFFAFATTASMSSPCPTSPTMAITSQL